jgi:hypothetical protein
MDPTAAEIRALVLATLVSILARGIGDGVALTFGGNRVRMGRWIVIDTNVAGVLVLLEVTSNGRGAGALCGRAADLRAAAPLRLRLAWINAQYGEEDTDP